MTALALFPAAPQVSEARDSPASELLAAAHAVPAAAGSPGGPEPAAEAVRLDRVI